jgi:transposase-like protein
LSWSHVQQSRKTERVEVSILKRDCQSRTVRQSPRTQSAARAAFFALKQQWGRLFPSAVQIIEKDLDSLLTFFQFDPTYWTVLRTTNPIERLNKEFKRRTRAMEVTGGEISTYRCLAYVAQTMEYRWSFHPLSQWSTVYTLNAA